MEQVADVGIKLSCARKFISMGKLLKRAAGRHAYLAQYISLSGRMQESYCSILSLLSLYTRAIFYGTRERLPYAKLSRVSPFQKISLFRAINSNLSRQSDTPKDCNMSPVMQKTHLHLFVICVCTTIFIFEAIFNTVLYSRY